MRNVYFIFLKLLGYDQHINSGKLISVFIIFIQNSLGQITIREHIQLLECTESREHYISIVFEICYE